MPDSALHQALLFVYAVLWGAITPSFGRLRLFAVNASSKRKQRRRRARRLFWGVAIGNLLPIAGLALLMWLPKVDGFWGIAAGGAIGLFPTVLSRVLHALTASNEVLAKHHSQSEARQVLRGWDEQWFCSIEESWDDDWKALADNDRASANSRRSHLVASGWMAALPTLALTAVMVLTALE